MGRIATPKKSRFSRLDEQARNLKLHRNQTPNGVIYPSLGQRTRPKFGRLTNPEAINVIDAPNLNEGLINELRGWYRALIRSGKQPSELYMNRNERVARW